MIRLFSNNYNQNAIFLLVFTLIIRTTGLFVPYVNSTVAIDINYLAAFFNALNHYSAIGFILSTGFIYATALIFNKICIQHELSITPSFLPAYFFVLLNSVFVEQFYAGPVLFVNLFMTISLGSILNLYNSNNTNIAIFSASTLAGLSALLNTTYITFFVIVLIGINLFRPFNFKENLSALFGFIMPLYIATMVNYLINNGFLPFHIFFPDYGNFNNPNWALYSALPGIGLIGLLAVIRMYRNFFRNSTKQRRFIQYMMLFLITSIILMSTGKQNARQEFSFLSLPLAYAFSFYFTNSKINWFKELLNLLLIASILYFRALT